MLDPFQPENPKTSNASRRSRKTFTISLRCRRTAWKAQDQREELVLRRVLTVGRNRTLACRQHRRLRSTLRQRYGEKCACRWLPRAAVFSRRIPLGSLDARRKPIGRRCHLGAGDTRCGPLRAGAYCTGLLPNSLPPPPLGLLRVIDSANSRHCRGSRLSGGGQFRTMSDRRRILMSAAILLRTSSAIPGARTGRPTRRNRARDSQLPPPSARGAGARS